MSKSKSKPETSHASRALSVINKLGRTLTAIEDPKQVLKQIAKDAREVLDADIVDLYEYNQGRDEFALPPVLVGERKNKHVPKHKIFKDDVVYKVVKVGKPKYFPDAQNAKPLTSKFEIPRPDAPEKRFVVREGILSSVSLPLQAGHETVGVMFVNYRTSQKFNDEQKSLIESFSNLAAIAISNSRLWKLQNEQLASFKEIIDVIGTKEKPLAEILKQTVNLLSANNGSIGRLTEDGQYIKHKVRWVNGNLEKDIKEDPISVSSGITGHVVRTKKPFRTGDVGKVKFYDPWYSTTKSELALPLKNVFGGVIGILNLESDSANFFTDEDEKLAESFANAASAAIQQADLIEDMQLLHYLTETHTLKELLDQILKNITSLMGDNTIASINLYDAENDFFYAFDGAGPNQKLIDEYLLIPPRKSGTGRYVLKTRAPLFYDDINNIPSGLPKVRSESAPYEITSFAVLPLVYQNDIVGTFFIQKIREHIKFTDDIKRILQTYANQAALAIHNAQRLMDVQPLKSILGAAVTESRETILKLIVEKAVDIIAADYASIWMLEQETGDLVSRAIFIKPEERDAFIPGLERIKRDQASINMSVYKEKRSIIVSDVQIAEEKGQYHRVYGKAKSEIAVPLVFGGEILGTLNAESKYLGAYSEFDKTTLRIFADVAAVAIVNSRAYEQINHRLIKKNTSLEAVIDMGKYLTASVDLNETQVLNLIYEKLHPLMETGNMYIALYDHATNIVRFPLMYIDGIATEVPGRKAGSGRTEYIIETKEPIFIATRDASIEWYKKTGREEYIGEPFASWMGVPMISGNRAIGVIATYHKTNDNVYDQDDLDVLQAIANQSAIALEVTHRVAELKALQGLTNDLNTELL